MKKLILVLLITLSSCKKINKPHVLTKMEIDSVDKLGSGVYIIKGDTVIIDHCW